MAKKLHIYASFPPYRLGGRSHMVFSQFGALLLAYSLSLALLSNCAFAETFSGKLRTIIEDNIDETSTTRRFLERGFGAPIELHSESLEAPAQLTSVRSNSDISVEGTIHDGEISVISVTDSGGSKGSSQSNLIGNTTRSVAAILINFQNASSDCTESEVNEMLFGNTEHNSVREVYLAASHGSMQLVGQVIGSVTLPIPLPSTCDYPNWAFAANSFANTLYGFNPNEWDHVTYVLPQATHCPQWVGASDFPGRSNYTRRCHQPGITAHEIGHNLNLNHAATAHSEYQDLSCVMGGEPSISRLFNAPHSVELGFTDSVTITTSGTYSLSALETRPTLAEHPQTYKVVTPAATYYLSLRVAVGIDQSLPAIYRNKLSVHTLPVEGDAYYTYAVRPVAAGGSVQLRQGPVVSVLSVDAQSGELVFSVSY